MMRSSNLDPLGLRAHQFRMFMQAHDADGILKGEINDMIKELGT